MSKVIVLMQISSHVRPAEIKKIADHLTSNKYLSLLYFLRSGMGGEEATFNMIKYFTGVLEIPPS